MECFNLTFVKHVKEMLCMEVTQELPIRPWLTQHSGTHLSFSLGVIMLTPKGHVYSWAKSSAWMGRGAGTVAVCHAVPCCVFCAPHSPPFLGQKAKDLPRQQGLFCSRDQWAHKWSLIVLTVALSLVLVLQMLCLTLQKSFVGKFTGEKSFVNSKPTPAAFNLSVWEQMSQKGRKENMLLFLFHRELKALKAMGLSHCTI